VANGIANFVYMSEAEYTHPGEIGSDLITMDKLICRRGADLTYYRIIVRNSSSCRHYELRDWCASPFGVYRSFSRYLGWTRGHHINTVTVSRYLDDTFTIPIDIPYDDPVIGCMSHWCGDTMRALCQKHAY